MQVTLSTEGLRRRTPNVYDDDFTFIVENQEYHCPTYIATFLSPRIHGILASDSTVRHFEIATNDPFGEFKHFLGLGEGMDLPITKANLTFYRSICLELWNRELFHSISRAFGDHLTTRSVVDRLAFLVKTDEPYDVEVAFCAAHFFEIDLRRLGELDLSVIWSILTHPDLKLFDEDLLYDFVRKLCETDLGHASLFECVRFDYLSPDSINTFLELVYSSFDILTFPVWAAVSARIALPVSPCVPNDRIVRSSYETDEGETAQFHTSADANSLWFEFDNSSSESASSTSV
jgi:hypothetical protein